MRKVYVGIDLGSSVCSAAYINEKGKLMGRFEFEPSEKRLIEGVKMKKGSVQVMIEESEMSGWVYRTLLPHVRKVVVSDPKRNCWISKSSVKNDPVDALKLAELLRLGSYAEVYHPEDDDMEAFKKAVQHEQEMTWKVAALKNQIKAQFRREGVVNRGQGIYAEKGRHKALSSISNKTVKAIIAGNYLLLAEMEKAKKRSRELVLSLCRKFPIIRAFEKVPGMGPVLAARFAAYVQTPHRFSNKRKLWRYSRLGVTDRASNGKPLGRRRIDRHGNGVLKDITRKVFDGAMRRKGSNLFQRSYEKYLGNVKDPRHARLSTQRKILSVLRAMWRDGTCYEDSIDNNRA